MFALSEEPYFCRSLKQGKTVLKWICHGCLVHFCEIRFLMRYELKLLLIDKITAFYCPTEYICQALNQTVTIKWTLKNSQASTEVYESHNLLQVRPYLCFYRHCYLFGFINVLNGYCFVSLNLSGGSSYC